MLWGCSKIIVKPGVKVITIEPSADALSVEEVDKLFSMAIEQVCALKEVQRLFCLTETCDVCRDNWACKRSLEHGRIDPEPQQGAR
jgi:hypothetical protein